MPSQKNLDQLTSLIGQFESAKAVVWANYAGLSVADQTQLRAQVIAAGGQFLVAKNNLIRLALEKTTGQPVSPEVKASLEGPTAILFCLDDAIAPLKVLVKFADDHDLPSLKLGYMDDKVLSVQEITDLSKLPSHDELIAKLIGQLKAPLYGLVNVAMGNLRGLVIALKAIKDQKGQ
jgi:large subunit ribosomal protein L10